MTKDDVIMAAIIISFSFPMIFPAKAEPRPAASDVRIVNVSGEREFSISIPKGEKTLRGYFVTASGKKRVNVVIKVDQDSGSVSWKE